MQDFMKFLVMRMRNWNRELTLEQGTNVDQKNHKNTDFQKARSNSISTCV